MGALLREEVTVFPGFSRHSLPHWALVSPGSLGPSSAPRGQYQGRAWTESLQGLPCWKVRCWAGLGSSSVWVTPDFSCPHTPGAPHVAGTGGHRGHSGPCHPVKPSIIDTNTSAGAWRAAGFKQDSERGGRFLPQCPSPLNSQLLLPKPSTSGGSGQAPSLESAAIEVLVPLFLTTSCPQVLSLWDPSSRSHVPFGQWTVQPATTALWAPRAHPAPLSQGHLQERPGARSLQELQALPCWTVLLGLR